MARKRKNKKRSKKTKEEIKEVYSQQPIQNINIREYNADNPKGLVNLGLTCYMNSLLQCFFHIIELRKYFISNKNNFNDDKPISKELAKVMYELKYGDCNNVKPEEFKKAISCRNKLFEGRKAGDVKDLFFNIIDCLLNELSSDSRETSEIEGIDLSDKNEILKDVEKEIDKDNIINKLFIGIYETIYKCPITNNLIFSFNIESNILFDLQNIKKYYNKENLTLDLCFEYYTRELQNNSFLCYICKDKQTNKSKNYIYRPPEILTIILDRGKGKLFRGRVELKKEIDLTKYIDKDFNNKFLYKLICISTHSGESSSSGHYTACCLNEKEEYYYFSDTYLKKIEDEKEIFKNEPYLLFYKKIENKINDYTNTNILEIKNKDKETHYFSDHFYEEPNKAFSQNQNLIINEDNNDKIQKDNNEVFENKNQKGKQIKENKKEINNEEKGKNKNLDNNLKMLRNQANNINNNINEKNKIKYIQEFNEDYKNNNSFNICNDSIYLQIKNYSENQKIGKQNIFK